MSASIQSGRASGSCIVTVHLALGAALLVALAQPVDAVTFSDSTFAPGDWSATVLSGNPGPSSYLQETTGGNPGAYRRMIHDFPGGSFAVYHEYTAASFDPATMPAGSVFAVEYHEDHIRLDGALLNFHPALRQDGVVYVAGTPQSESGFDIWNSFDPGLYGPSEFEQYGAGPIAHPDFSSSGSPIHFGYVRFVGYWGSPVVYDLGIDNWSVSVSAVPVGTVLRQHKISGLFQDGDRFGECVAYLGDLDGNGIGDLASAILTAGPFPNEAGSVVPLRMDRDPFFGDFVLDFSVIAPEVAPLLNDGRGSFGLVARGIPGDRFGQCVEGIGDLNHDGVPDLAVGSEQGREGAVWILFLNPDATVQSERRIASGVWGFPDGVLATGDNFGRDIARLGDLDGDGNVDLAVAAPYHDDGGTDRGAVFILFLEPDGLVKSWTRISHSSLPTLGLDDGDRFGFGVTGPGDVDGDGVPDLAAGAFFDDDAGSDAGAVHVLLMNPDGTVKSHAKLGNAAVGGGLSAGDRFGIGLAAPGDLDGDGVPDLAAGASRDDDGGTDKGAVWLILLNPDGSAKGFEKISATAGGFTGPLDAGDEFGMDLESWVGPAGQRRLAIGARMDDDGGTNRGALHILDIAAAVGGPVCGDFLREAQESCDDGNATAADGCNATCEVEQALFLSGTAGGGTLTATVDGVPVVVPTTPGQSAKDALGAVAAAINADANLIALGRTAAARDQALFVDGSASLVSGDGGLTTGERDDLHLVDSRLDLEVWLPPLSPIYPLRPALDQGVAPPVEVLAFEDGGLDLASPVPLTGSGSTSTGPLTVFTWSVSGIPFGPCDAATGPIAIGTPPFQISLPQTGRRCAQTTGGTFGLHRARYQTSIDPGSMTQPGIPAPLGRGRIAASAGFFGLSWTTRSAVGRLVTPYHPETIVGRGRGLAARTPGGEGVLNLVTPTRVIRSGDFGSRLSDVTLTRLRLRFAPEPATGLALAVAAALLGVLGVRIRYRTHRP